MSSFTVTLSGRSSVLESFFFPPIELDSGKNYALALIDLMVFNSIPNIDVENNVLHIRGHPTIIFPIGSYEITDIEEFAKRFVPSFSLKANNNTLQSEIYCDYAIDFTQENSIGPTLGFGNRILTAKTIHVSENPVDILKINTIRVETNITEGAFFNGVKTRTIHEFFPEVAPGFKIIESPSTPIFHPIVNVREIPFIRVRIVDQAGHLVNFRGEEITIRLHVKDYGSRIW